MDKVKCMKCNVVVPCCDSILYMRKAMNYYDAVCETCAKSEYYKQDSKLIPTES